MTTGARVTKQIVILVVFLLVIGGIGYGGYAVFVPEKPTPTPNPTINLSPVIIVSQKLINVENNDYDFLAKVNNPNTDYGSPDVEYQITFLNAAGTQILQKSDFFYILPGQTKYVVNTPLKFNEPVAQAEVKIISIDWQQMDSLSSENISLLPRNISYNEISATGIFSKVGGSIQNDSNFDFGQVSVLVILLNGVSEPIAVNKTEIMTFMAKTTRGFETTWYQPFADEVSQTEVEAYTNIFENSNFLRQYERTEKFQQFY